MVLTWFPRCCAVTGKRSFALVPASERFAPRALLDGPRPGPCLRPASDRPPPPQSGSGVSAFSTSNPVGSLGGNSAPREARARPAPGPAETGSPSVWPNIVPVARTANPGCWRRNAFSSEVTGSAPVAPVIRLPLSPATPSFGHSASSDSGHRARLLALREIGDHLGQFCIGLGAARFGMLARFQHQEAAGGAERKTAVGRRAARPAHTSLSD